MGSQGLVAKHETSAGHPKAEQEKGQVQEQGTCLHIPQALRRWPGHFPALLPKMGTSHHVSVLLQKMAGWGAQVVETSDAFDSTPQMSSD